MTLTAWTALLLAFVCVVSVAQLVVVLVVWRLFLSSKARRWIVHPTTDTGERPAEGGDS